MIDLDSIEGFEWDEANSDKNLIKHKVTNKECEEVFKNKPLLIKLDEVHFTSEVHSTSKEKRYNALGRTGIQRKLFLSFTLREEKIRVISARDMSKKERKLYYEKEKEKI